MSQITVRTAELEDLLMIAELKRDAYGVRGYCSRKRAQEQYLNMKNEFALMAEIDGKTVGTMSVIYAEGGRKLPSDEYFPIQTDEVRKTSGKIAYYGTFAVQSGMWARGECSVGLALIREAIRRAKQEAINAKIIIVHPRHVSFYMALGFEEVARRDNMPGLEKAPAVMMVLAGVALQSLFAKYTGDNKNLYQKPEHRLAHNEESAVA